MKRLIVSVSVILASAIAGAQEPQFGLADRRVMELKAQLEGKLRAAVEMRTTTGAPYSAEATTEFLQALADGNRIVRKSIVRIYRDSEGRVRRENVTSDGGRVESVTIVDPVSGSNVLLDPDSRTAYGEPGRLGRRGAPGPATAREEERRKAERAELELKQQIEAARGAAPPPPVPAPTAIARRRTPEGGSEQATRQDLGQRTIEGVVARGTRMTTVIPAGAIGNDQPIRIVSEEWFSADLQVLVLTKHSDPRSGETTYTLSNIIRAEPDRSLFEIPPDYTRK